MKETQTDNLTCVLVDGLNSAAIIKSVGLLSAAEEAGNHSLFYDCSSLSSIQHRFNLCFPFVCVFSCFFFLKMNNSLLFVCATWHATVFSAKLVFNGKIIQKQTLS